MPVTRRQHIDSLAVPAPPAQLLKLEDSQEHRSRFFTDLPPEIRNVIYDYCFGFGTLSLRLAHEPRRMPARLAQSWNTGIQSEVKILQGFRWNNRWRNARGKRCKLGALGWLLSCRQAYREALPRILRSNTLRVEDYQSSFFRAGSREDRPAVLPNIPQIIPPAFLTCVRRIKLDWSVSCWVDDPTRLRKQPGVVALLNTLSANFPSLNSIHITIDTRNAFHRRSSLGVNSLVAGFIRPMDAMVQRLNIQQDLCIVYIDRDAYSKLQGHFGNDEQHVQLLPSAFRPAMRRFVPGVLNGFGYEIRSVLKPFMVAW